MGGEWFETTIGDQATLQRGTDITKLEQRVGNIPVISSGGISSYHDTAQMRGPGVILGRKGVVGSVYYIDSDYWAHDTTLWVKDFHGNDRRFVYYFFKHLAPRLARMDVGSANPTLNRNHVHPIEVLWPPLPEQRTIAHILGALDDKIELNRRMSETLEAMAGALFQSWFVDFDPVRAKMEGRWRKGESLPCLPAHLYDLFPDSFEGSELGEIPVGWGIKSIYDIADVVYGAPFSSSQFNPDGNGRPLIRIRDLPGERPQIWTPEIHPKAYMVRPGDIVVGMDGEFRAYLWGGDEAWLNQRVCVFVPKKECSAAFVRNSIIRPLADIEATETATTVIHLGKSDIDRFTVVVPSAAVLAAFNRICQPWYDQVVVTKRESRTVIHVRDSLLPRLISGDICLDEVQYLVEATMVR